MLIKLAALGALGYAGYRYFEKNKPQQRAAFAGNEGNVAVRDAGPDAMRDTPVRGWDATDQQIDESFPASDPPGNY